MIPIFPDSTKSYGLLPCDGHLTQEARIYHRVADNFWLSFSTTAGIELRPDNAAFKPLPRVPSVCIAITSATLGAGSEKSLSRQA